MSTTCLGVLSVLQPIMYTVLLYLCVQNGLYRFSDVCPVLDADRVRFVLRTEKSLLSSHSRSDRSVSHGCELRNLSVVSERDLYGGIGVYFDILRNIYGELYRASALFIFRCASERRNKGAAKRAVWL